MLLLTIDGKGDLNTRALIIVLLFKACMDCRVPSKWVTRRFWNMLYPPLEGFWTVTDSNFKGSGLPITDKSKFIWKMMIRQPYCVRRTL